MQALKANSQYKEKDADPSPDQRRDSVGKKLRLEY